jgi:hypothetical protein
VSNPGPTPPRDVQQQATPPATRTSRAAIASFVLSLLGFCFSLFTGIPAVICGIVALINIGASNGRLRGKGFAIAGIVIAGLQVVLIPFMGILVALLLPAVQMARESSQRIDSKNRMRNIAVAMHNFDSARNGLPPVSADLQGKAPTLSWRVYLLPYVEEAFVYDRFDMQKPWDSPENLALVKPMPWAYQTARDDLDPGETNYLVVTGPGTIFPANTPGRRSWDNIKDGVTKTIMLVEVNVDEAAIWSEPKDWQFDPNNPMRGLGEYRYGGFIAVMADGSSHFIDDDVDLEVLSALFTANGGESVDVDEATGR